MTQATVTYFHNSGFMVRTGSILLVFDYWRGEDGALPVESRLTERDFADCTQIVFFVSHAHQDHFDSVIYDFNYTKYKINYIVDKEVPQKILNFNICQRIHEGETVPVGPVTVTAFGSTDAVVPALAIKVLPAGLTGLALSGILSVIMSTADSYLLVSVQTCVHDIGKTINPNMSEKKEITLSRIFSIILPIGALIIALYIQNAYNILMFAWSFYAAAAGLPAFAALYWRKATKEGIIAAMVAGFAVCVGWKLCGTPFGLGPTVPGAIACAVALVCVSLATYKKNPSPFLEAEATA